MHAQSDKAENCYWGGGAPVPGEISGNVDYTPHTTTLPSPVGWGQSDTYDPSYIKVSGSRKTIAELSSPETPPDMMASAGTLGMNGSKTDWTEEDDTGSMNLPIPDFQTY